MKLYTRKDGCTIGCWASKDNSKNIKITVENETTSVLDKSEKALQKITNMVKREIGSPFKDIPVDNIEY